MKCELCQQQKAETVLYRSKEDGAQEELYVCHGCAERERVFGQERGIQVATMETPEPEGEQMGLPEGLLPKGIERTMKAAFEEITERLQEMGLSPEGLLPSSERCPACGMPLDEVRLAGRIGCASCVKAFEETIKAMLDESQGCSVYGGEIPERQGLVVRLEELRAAYERALAEENYQEAKELSQTIEALKRRLEETEGTEGGPRDA